MPIPPDSPRELITVEHFMNLSAELNYHLSATRPNLNALLALVIGQKRFERETPLLLALRCVLLGYGSHRRKLGPLAVLHPLRTAALISRSVENPTMLDLLGALLHDKGEDLKPEMIPSENLYECNEVYNNLLKQLDRDDEWFIGERIDLLTRRSRQPYNEYLLNLMDHVREMPDLLHVKLADRLDNTLDNHIGRPGVLRYNFYRTVFDILFVPVFQGVKISQYHFLPSPEEGGTLVMQLFKNAVFLSLLRHEKLDKLDDATMKLFDAVAIASIREAQWIALELFADYGEDKELGRLREMLLDTMKYAHSGGATEVHSSGDPHGLDGIFLERYEVADAAERKNRMADLFQDKEYLVTALVTFIAGFAGFLNNPDFAIRGIDREGIRPVLPKRSPGRKTKPEGGSKRPAGKSIRKATHGGNGHGSSAKTRKAGGK